MPLKFYEIGKANAEIERLQAELDATAAQLQARQGELDTTKAEALKALDEVQSLKKQLADEKANAAQQLESAAAQLKVVQANTEQIASAKALEIAQGQGIPPVAFKPTEMPGKANISANLRGHDRVVAAIEAQIAEYQVNKRN